MKVESYMIAENTWLSVAIANIGSEEIVKRAKDITRSSSIRRVKYKMRCYLSYHNAHPKQATKAMPEIEYHFDVVEGHSVWMATAETSKGSIQTGWHSTKERARKEAISMIEKEQG